MQLVSLDKFIGGIADAGLLARQTGMSLTQAVNTINLQREEERRQEEAEAKKKLRYEQLLPLLNGSPGTIKLANKLGEEDREDLAQVDPYKVKEDDTIPTGTMEFVDPKKLKPVQADACTCQDKVDAMAANWDKAGKVPVIISKNNYILDGHHRVEAAKKKNKWVRVFRINLPAREALKLLKQQ